jgi:hypothetical protein
MKFITKIGIACSTIAMMASTMSYAGTVTTGELVDNYIGSVGSSPSSSDYTPNDNYDIQWMKVARTLDGSVGSLTVTIKSNFVSHNDDSWYSFGDLFLMNADANSGNYQTADSCISGTAIGCNQYTENLNNPSSTDPNISPNKWQYAFDLGGTTNHYRKAARDKTHDDNVNIVGRLREIDQTNYNNQVISTNSDRKWQAILVSNNADEKHRGTWSTDASEDELSMTFDITGTSLMGAAQLALRWQMTCANDVIEVVTNFGSGGTGTGVTPVSEPSSIMLMLFAGFGLFAARQKKAIKFKA